MTPEQYQELLEGEEWSPAIRAEFQRRKATAQQRRERIALISERTRHELAVGAWQSDVLRKLKQLHSDYFEIAAWNRRERVPMLAAEAGNRLLPKVRGVQQRLAKARREGADGCTLQARWLELHAELIAEVERYWLSEQPGNISKAAPDC